MKVEGSAYRNIFRHSKCFEEVSLTAFHQIMTCRKGFFNQGICCGMNELKSNRELGGNVLEAPLEAILDLVGLHNDLWRTSLRVCTSLKRKPTEPPSMQSLKNPRNCSEDRYAIVGDQSADARISEQSCTWRDSTTTPGKGPRVIPSHLK